MAGSTSILYVDDDLDDQQLIRELLSEAEGDFTLECVPTYTAAIDRLLNGDHDVCLLDYRLGVRTGLDVLREAMVSENRVPIVILTGCGSHALDVEAAKLGAVDYLVKEEVSALILERTIRYAVSAARATKKLRESDERYVLAALGANDGLWDWCLQSNTIAFSPRWRSIFGYEEIGDDPSEWMSRVHPDERETVEDAIARHIRGESEFLEVTHRMRHANGTYRWTLVRAAAGRGRDGVAHRIAGSHMDITTFREAEDLLVERSFFDEMTGLPNRDLFLDIATEAALAADPSNNRLCAMLAVRVDAATSVGLTLGQRAAERFIAETVDRFQGCLRQGDIIARLGDSEFGILLPQIHDHAAVLQIAEQLRDAMRRPLPISGGEVITTISVGIAEAVDSTSGDDLLARALAALAQTRTAGSNGPQAFDENLHAHTVSNLHLEADLRTAITEGALSVHYQPIVSLRTGAIKSFEALVRWRHPERGLLLPDDFIPLAEASDMIRALDKFVLTTAVADFAGWRKAVPAVDSMAVAVNCSTQHFADSGVVPWISDALGAAGIESRHLVLELTESILIEDPNVAIDILNDLNSLGVTIALDDFGTGFSALSYLHRLPLSVLKLDRSFVSELSNGDGTADVVRSIVGLARNLGLRVIAEGVEKQAQLRELQKMGCHEAQGFYLGHPVDAAGAMTLIEKQAEGDLFLSAEDGAKVSAHLSAVRGASVDDGASASSMETSK